MDLSRLGSDLLGETEAKTLAALARLADPVSGRHLAKLADNQSPSTVLRYLNRLRDIGLVLATETPASTLYRLNRAHVLWQPIEDVLAAPAKVEQSLAEYVDGELGRHARIAVFGSVARGSSTHESDYDLLLVVDASVPAADRSRVADELSRLVENIAGNEGHVFDLSGAELKDLASRNSPLVQEWKRDARPIDGRGPIIELRALA